MVLSKIISLLLSFGFILSFNSCLTSNNSNNTSQLSEISARAIGPKNGRILLLGGGILQIHADLFKKFAYHDSIDVVIVPSALSDDELENIKEIKKIEQCFKKLGINNFKILHSRDTNVINSEAFIGKIDSAMGIFFLGGNTELLVNTYKNTMAELAFNNLLKRGGIIAGVSAGSGAQASFIQKDSLFSGFKFLKNTIISNHYLARNKQFDIIETIQKNPSYIAFGIDDRTGILIHKQQFEVIGESYVAVYDGSYFSRRLDSVWKISPESERFYLLRNGDSYNLHISRVDLLKKRKKLELPIESLRQYKGNYKSKEKEFELTFTIKDSTLHVKNSWGWDPYPVYPFEKDLFFAINRNMWFRFNRDKNLNQIHSVSKIKSLIQKKEIARCYR